MAAPDLITLLQAMHVLAGRLVDAAGRAEWDEVFEQLPAWQTLQGGLRDINWQALPTNERQMLADELRAMQQQIEQLVAQAEAWRPELAALLQDNTNASRLQQTYR
ncbi:hypothetical protein IGB42_00113 [Andreprevotia sp. IGB-42]|uniref:flagellar protein FliT n=1 Tax=Andreprevotia sp. IGB-42 TaxID=2497473 RepID=UPI00135BC645|nr:flagellar protein FliT [Andreprevotia sp. IGB-42]KAF0815036.1 hypothetical protein IGB42_00113 [Andreprevotia sp. IGB-42]